LSNRMAPKLTAEERELKRRNAARAKLEKRLEKEQKQVTMKAHCWKYGIASFSKKHFEEHEQALKSNSFDADGLKVFNGENAVELRLDGRTGGDYPSVRVKRNWPEINENSQDIEYIELEEERIFCFRDHPDDFSRFIQVCREEQVSFIIVDTHLNRVNFEKKLIAFNLNENLDGKFKVLQTSKDRSWLGCVIAAIKAILEGPSKREKDKEYSEIDNKVRITSADDCSALFKRFLLTITGIQEVHIPLIIEQLPDFQTAQRIATDEFRYKQAFEKLANSYVNRGEGGGATHQRFGTKLAKRVLTFFDDKPMRTILD